MKKVDEYVSCHKQMSLDSMRQAIRTVEFYKDQYHRLCKRSDCDHHFEQFTDESILAPGKYWQCSLCNLQVWFNPTEDR